jgi:hypothetical protein
MPLPCGCKLEPTDLAKCFICTELGCPVHAFSININICCPCMFTFQFGRTIHLEFAKTDDRLEIDVSDLRDSCSYIFKLQDHYYKYKMMPTREQEHIYQEVTKREYENRAAKKSDDEEIDTNNNNNNNNPGLDNGYNQQSNYNYNNNNINCNDNDNNNNSMHE